LNDLPEVNEDITLSQCLLKSKTNGKTVMENSTSEELNGGRGKKSET